MSKIKDAIIDDLNMIKEKPILMSTPMVQATLKDIDPKTQTRRTKGLDKINICPDSYKFIGFKNTLGYPASEGFLWAGFQHKDSPSPIYIKCPYGQIGDRLWVRETFMFNKGADVRESFVGTTSEFVLGEPPHYLYKASSDKLRGFKWRPSIFMPRKASRITLEITDIKIQRLWEITEDDAKAEGIGVSETLVFNDSYKDSYAWLWDKINKKHVWILNEWVWVISFKRVQ